MTVDAALDLGFAAKGVRHQQSGAKAQADREP
jgi:hypothetical protein